MKYCHHDALVLLGDSYRFPTPVWCLRRKGHWGKHGYGHIGQTSRPRTALRDVIRRMLRRLLDAVR